mmetsp:Transcript_18028/g.42263  ORF Transcript_18028/g.42263 Transcript_18028/m.42263 type:complete len:416 (-) Transcript_18028:321-1568(-)
MASHNPTTQPAGFEVDYLADDANENANTNLVRSFSNSSSCHDSSADGSPLIRRYSHSAHDSRPGGGFQAQPYVPVAAAEHPIAELGRANSLQRANSLDPHGLDPLSSWDGSGGGSPWLFSSTVGQHVGGPGNDFEMDSYVTNPQGSMALDDGWTFASTEFPPPTPHQSTVVESYITPNISGTHASPDGHPRAALPNPATTKFGGGMMPTRQSGREKTPRVPCNMAEETPRNLKGATAAHKQLKSTVKGKPKGKGKPLAQLGHAPSNIDKSAKSTKFAKKSSSKSGGGDGCMQTVPMSNKLEPGEFCGQEKGVTIKDPATGEVETVVLVWVYEPKTEKGAWTFPRPADQPVLKPSKNLKDLRENRKMLAKRLKQKRLLGRMSGASHYQERSDAIKNRQRVGGRVVSETAKKQKKPR